MPDVDVQGDLQELRNRVAALERTINGNGQPGLAENVRLLTTRLQGLLDTNKSLAGQLQHVEQTLNDMKLARDLEDARQQGSRRAIAQTRVTTGILLVLMGIDTVFGLDAPALISLLFRLPGS